MAPYRPGQRRRTAINDDGGENEAHDTITQVLLDQGENPLAQAEVDPIHDATETEVVENNENIIAEPILENEQTEHKIEDEHIDEPVASTEPVIETEQDEKQENDSEHKKPSIINNPWGSEAPDELVTPKNSTETQSVEVEKAVVVPENSPTEPETTIETKPAMHSAWEADEPVRKEEVAPEPPPHVISTPATSQAQSASTGASVDTSSSSDVGTPSPTPENENLSNIDLLASSIFDRIAGERIKRDDAYQTKLRESQAVPKNQSQKQGQGGLGLGGGLKKIGDMFNSEEKKARADSLRFNEGNNREMLERTNKFFGSYNERLNNLNNAVQNYDPNKDGDGKQSQAIKKARIDFVRDFALATEGLDELTKRGVIGQGQEGEKLHKAVKEMGNDIYKKNNSLNDLLDTKGLKDTPENESALKKLMDDTMEKMRAVIQRIVESVQKLAGNVMGAFGR